MIPKETELCVLFVLLNTEDQFVRLWMKIETGFDGFILYLSTHSLQRQNVLYGHGQNKDVRSCVFKIF